MYSLADDGGTQVTQVGESFIPGPEANAAIAELFGYQAEVRDGQAFVFSYELGGAPTQAPQWLLCRDYCGDSVGTAELIEFKGRVPYVKPLRKEAGQRKQRYVCLFDHESGVAVTKPFMQESHALAAALHFIMSENKS